MRAAVSNGTQSFELAAPVEMVVKPRSQAVQVLELVAPVAELYVPGEHMEHGSWPDELYDPGRQSWSLVLQR